MFDFMNKPGFSIWLKPIFKSLDGIIECETKTDIGYQDIKPGDILEFEYKNANNTAQKQVYISTSRWSAGSNTGSFITLTGKQLLLSAKMLNQLKIFRIGVFQA